MLDAQDRAWLDAMLDQKLDDKLKPIRDQLDTLTEGVRLLLSAHPHLWEHSPFKQPHRPEGVGEA